MIKKHLSLVLAFAFCALLFIPQAKVYSKKRLEARQDYVPNQILVKLKTDITPFPGNLPIAEDLQLAKDILPESGTKAESLSGELQSGLYLIELDGNTTVQEAIAQAQKNPRVLYAEPNFLIEPQETLPNDVRFAEMWSLYNTSKEGADIGATRAWDLTTGSSNTVVAITDTGVDINHPDLAANIWTNPNEIAGNGIDDDNNGLVDDVNGWNFFDDIKTVYDNFTGDRHGTFVSGIIGAVGNNGIGVTGVAWNVKLMPLKFISNGSGNIAGAVRAINYAIAQKKKGVNLRVINASWGPSASECTTSFSQSLKDVFMAAGDANILIVCSAGNGICGSSRSIGDDLDIAPEYPAAWAGELTNVISVAATDRTDNVLSFSNFGHANVSVGAPGDGFLVSTYPEGIYATFAPGGTSFAAPHVTGIAALLASREPALTPAQMKQRIISTAEPILPLASKVAGSGRANAYNALANRTAALPPLGINAIQLSKKFVDIDGLGFVQGAMAVEVDGQAVAYNTKYDGGYTLANGSFTRVFLKMPKPDLRALFPSGVAKNVTVVNKTTGQRSNVFTVTNR